MNVDDALDLAYRERDRIAALDLAGADRVVGWTVKLDRAKRRLGLTAFDRRVVTLSRPIVELNPHRVIEATVRHEWAHVIAGEGVGHGHAWKTAAHAVGAPPTTCATGPIAAPPARYRAWCTRCNDLLPGGRHRTSAALGRAGWTHHGPCSGRVLWIDTATRSRRALDGTPLPHTARAILAATPTPAPAPTSTRTPA